MCLLGMGVLGMPVFADCSKTLVVNQATWEPYMYRDDSGNLKGFDYELVRSVLDLAGCDYVFVEHPSKRALLDLKEGTVDLVAGASITDERRRFGRFTREYRQERIELIIRADDQDHFPAASLQQFISEFPVVLGAVNGGYYGPEYDALDSEVLVDRGRLILVRNTSQLISMLGLGRIDAIVGDVVSIYRVAVTLGHADSIALHGLHLNADPVHLMLSRMSTTQADRDAIDDAIGEFLSSEAYRALLARYGLEVLGVGVMAEDNND